MGWVLFSFHLQRSYALIVFNQCATLYLVRIFSAARCAGFRQKKSPGRVGRCRIPQRKSLRRCLGFFLCASCQLLLPGRFQANVQHCTWLGSPVCAASGGSSTWGNTWESRTLPDSMKKGLTPYGVGSFFIPSATFLCSDRLQSMCDIVLG